MTLRVGLVGAGIWSRKVHAVALATHPGISFAGVWSRSDGSREKLALDCGVQPHDSVDELLDDVDAVVIAVPPAAQVPLARRAARRGKHMLLEKPVAEHRQDAIVLAEEVDAAGVASLVFLARLFDPEVSRWMTSRRAESWKRARVTWESGNYLPGSVFAGGWRAQSGAMVDVGPHILANLALSMGPIESLRVSERSVDRISFECEHSSGARSEAHVKMDSVISRTTETYEYSKMTQALTSPAWDVDFVQASRTALSVLLASARSPNPKASPAMSLCTLDSAVRMVELVESAQNFMILESP